MKLATTLLTGTLILGGLGAGAYAMTDKQPLQSVSANSTTISEEQAKEIALEQTNGGNITKMSVDTDDRTKKYEFDIVNGEFEYDVDIDFNSGKVVEFDQERLDSDDDGDDDRDDGISIEEAKLSLEEAKKLALKEQAGTIVETELDRDDNQLRYEIEIHTDDNHEVNVDIDAMNGNVLNVEWDD
ncbi:PepSY domain-containing protein [Priestia flexa]|uniref:PepSY domain-containing protein n=1 Tax=Priestia flexa TaxID=86664 RepID=UPI00240E0193|nr:PepSY domain-containing protein [Priestia flexa]WEZ08553.1 PepSY domain-containing protein [Priestia flexa]